MQAIIKILTNTKLLQSKSCKHFISQKELNLLGITMVFKVLGGTITKGAMLVVGEVLILPLDRGVRFT